MPAYAYTGLNANGKPVKGIESADTVSVLKATLKRKGVYLTAVTETAAAAAAARGSQTGNSLLSTQFDLTSITQRIKPNLVGHTTRLLSTLLCAGVTLPESLDALADQAQNPRWRAILSNISGKVREGASLADSMASHSKVFSPLYLNLVRAGESSGALETVLLRLSVFMEKSEETKSKVSQALIYPVLMALVATGVVSLLMVKVVPQITQMFEDQSDLQLPVATEILIFISDSMVNYWWAMLALVAVSSVFFRRWRNSKAGRIASDRAILNIPLVGDFVRKVAISRFARTLSTMIGSGVQLLSALDTVAGTLGNVVLESVVTEARDEIREGGSIGAAIQRSGEFPPLVSHMIRVGERSGQLEQMLSDVADAYDRETNDALAKAMAALEPLLMVVMAVAVGFIVFAIMTPIMKMNQMFAG